MATFVSRIKPAAKILGNAAKNFGTAKDSPHTLSTILHNARNGGINPFTLYTQGSGINEQTLLAIQPPELTRSKWDARRDNASLVQITDEERDAMQSILKAFPKNVGTIEQYHTELGKFNAAGPVRLLKNTVGGGGTRGQLPVMAGHDPYELTDRFALASISDPLLGFSELLREESADALRARPYDVYKKHIKTKALACAKHGKTYDIRGFDFANQHAINLSNLLNIVEELHGEGITNININLEHSYKPDMSVQEVGQSIIGAALLGFDTAGVKSFAPNLNAHKAREVVLWTDGELHKAADIAETMGDNERAQQLRNFAIVVHGHYSENPEESHLPILSPERTDTFGAAGALVQTAKETGRQLILHATCPVNFDKMKGYKTHYSYGEILEAIAKHGVAPVTDEHFKVLASMTETQQRTMDDNKALWAINPTSQSMPSNKPGGGGPAEVVDIENLHKFIIEEAKHNPNIKPLSSAQVQEMWDKELKRKEENATVTSHVTPCFKGTCQLTDHVLRNRAKGLPEYSGTLHDIAVDVLRKQPSDIPDQEALKVAYTQHLTKTLKVMVEAKKLSESQRDAILGFNLDKGKISQYLESEQISPTLQADIIEASGMKTRPTITNGGLATAKAKLEKMGHNREGLISLDHASLLMGMYDDLAIPVIERRMPAPQEAGKKAIYDNNLLMHVYDGDKSLLRECFETVSPGSNSPSHVEALEKSRKDRSLNVA